MYPYATNLTLFSGLLWKICNILLLGMLVILPSVAFAQAQKSVTVDFENATMSKALTVIEQQTGVNFTYNADQLRVHPNVTYSCSGKTVDVVLQEILDKSFEFRTSGNNIVIMKKQSVSSDRTDRISGAVTDRE